MFEPNTWSYNMALFGGWIAFWYVVGKVIHTAYITFKEGPK